MSFVYLASPYSHPSDRVMEWRAEEAARIAAMFAREGVNLFCPISHSHPWTKYGVPQDWAFWENLDMPFLEAATELWVLKLPGWQDSNGVNAEIRIVEGMGKPVEFIPWMPGPNGGQPDD